MFIFIRLQHLRALLLVNCWVSDLTPRFLGFKAVVYVYMFSVKLGKTMQRNESDIFGQRLNQEFIGNQRLPFQNF